MTGLRQLPNATMIRRMRMIMRLLLWLTLFALLLSNYYWLAHLL